ncbi:hypothetical protein EVAR_57218_1 [Eumeta japonica]|uniref:Gustatory receptor n=1 Tax=Eumeta variegata TaxID=151549 RepID=A0A4C1YK93_EUMVA|nr:hypothetical protein EVAR_57218_1 [Eumeta japonica]
MSFAINLYYQVDVTGLFQGLWWCATLFIIHFYMISVAATSYSISEVMTKLNLAVQKILPKGNDENILLEGNANELLCGTLKRIENAYDDLCNCCSTLNDIFGFPEIFAGFMNILQLGIAFFAMTMMAVSFEAVQRAARGLRRSLALLSSELHAGESALSYATIKNCVAESKRGRTSVQDESRFGRPKSVITPESISKVHEMVLADRKLKLSEMADSVFISKERIHRILNYLPKSQTVPGDYYADLLHKLHECIQQKKPGDISLDVRMLTRDVLHAVRARQPRLSACGLFELRMTLLTGLISLTATYSIVLLQFTHSVNKELLNGLNNGEVTVEKFEFTVSPEGDGKSNVLTITSVTTSDETVYALPKILQAAGHHREIIKHRPTVKGKSV